MAEQTIDDASGGYVVERGEAAIVTMDGMKHMSLLVPSMQADAPVPELMLYLTAVMVRGQDPEFFREQIEWMEEQRNG